MATGFAFGGQCFSSVSDAAKSFCAAWSSSGSNLGSSGSYLFLRKPNTCTYDSVLSKVTITDSVKPISFNGTAWTYYSSTTDVSTFSVSFAACDFPSSDADQITAVNGLFGPVLAMLVLIWALSLIRRFLLRSPALPSSTGGENV